MTHDERISSYIDNELSAEQEQEFLISLAASDGLRRSFRSELVMKKVLHRDEQAVNPPRRLRGAVFAAVGLAGASAMSAEPAHAAARTTTSVVKALFASKVGALVTVAGIGTSALIGYGVRTAVEPAPVASHSVVTQAPAVTAPVQMQQANEVVSAPQQQVLDRHQSAVSAKRNVVPAASSDKASAAKREVDPVNGVAGGGQVLMTNPRVDTNTK